MQLGVLPFEGSPRTFALALLVCVLAYLTVCGFVFWQGSLSCAVNGLRKAIASSLAPASRPASFKTASRTSRPTDGRSISFELPPVAPPPTACASGSTWPMVEVDIGTTDAVELQELPPLRKKNIMARVVRSRDPADDD